MGQIHAELLGMVVCMVLAVESLQGGLSLEVSCKSKTLKTY